MKGLNKLKYNMKSGFRHGFKNVIFSKFFFGFLTSLSMIISSHDKAGRVKDNLDARFNGQEDTFDFIVVGGGSAGLIVANRLSENHKVLLLEAGGEPHPLQRIPGMAFFMVNHKETDWMHRTVPQRRACFASPHRRSGWSQGRNLGGSGNLNYMVHLRGSPRDYDYWAKITGDESWSYSGVLPYFRRHENYQGDSPDREAHGFDGELKLEIPSYTGMAKEFIRAGQELGYEHVDLNARYEEGFDTIFCPMEGGERRSSFAAFLDPIRERETLVIRKYAHVNKVLIRGFDNTAFGVEYDRHGLKRYAYATKEVIVSAGTVETAKLLMLSGIGPKTHLADLGIPLVASLPVGKNLQDHLATFLGPFFIDPPRSYLIDRDITLKSFYEYKSDGNGPLSTSLFQAAAMISSKHAKDAGVWNWPDIQLLMSGMAGHKTFAKDMAHAFHLNYKTIKKYYDHALGRDSFFIAVSASRPLGRGEIVLEKRDPYASASINPRYLENDHDMHIMIEGIKTAMYLVENTTSFQNLRARFTSKKFPGCEHMAFRSDDYFECFVRHFSVSLNDPVGTCAMGNPHMGKDGVLDSQLQVIGVHHLRVIDASVMPTIVGSHTEAAVMMIAEKGADMILEAWKTRETSESPFKPNFHQSHGHDDSHGQPHDGPPHGPPNNDHGPPNNDYGPPNNDHGPPNNYRGPQNNDHEPPNNDIGPPDNYNGPPNNNYGPPNNNYGPPNNNYGPSNDQLDDGYRPGNGGYPKYGPPSTSEIPPNPSAFGGYTNNGPPNNFGGPPSENNHSGPPKNNYNGPPPMPPNNNGSPPPGNYNGPPPGYNGPPNNYNGPPPGSNGQPLTNYGPPNNYNGPPPSNSGPSFNGPLGTNYGPPNNNNSPPPNNNGPNNYGPPGTNYGPPNNYNPSPLGGNTDNYNGPPPPSLNKNPPGPYSSPIIANNGSSGHSNNNRPSLNSNANGNTQGGYSSPQFPNPLMSPPDLVNNRKDVIHPRHNLLAEDNEMTTTETVSNFLPFEKNSLSDRVESSIPKPLTSTDETMRNSLDIDDIITTSESSRTTTTLDPDVFASSFTQDDYKPSRFDDGTNRSGNKSSPSASRPDVTLLTHDTKMRPGVQVSNPFPDMYYPNLGSPTMLSPIEFRMKYPITSTVEYPNKIPYPPELGPVYFRNPEYTTRKPFLFGNATRERMMVDDPPGYNASITAAARIVSLSNIPEYRPYNDRSRQPDDGHLKPHVVFKSVGMSNKVPSTANVPNPYYSVKDQSSKDHMRNSELAGGTSKDAEFPASYLKNLGSHSKINGNQVRGGSSDLNSAISDSTQTSTQRNTSSPQNSQSSTDSLVMGKDVEPTPIASGSSNAQRVKKPRDKIIGFKRRPKSVSLNVTLNDSEAVTQKPLTTLPTFKPKFLGRIIRIKNSINWATTEVPRATNSTSVLTTQRPETTKPTNKMRVEIKFKNTPVQLNTFDEDSKSSPLPSSSQLSSEFKLSSTFPRMNTNGPKGVKELPLNAISRGPVTITPRPLLSVTIWPDYAKEEEDVLKKSTRQFHTGDEGATSPMFLVPTPPGKRSEIFGGGGRKRLPYLTDDKREEDNLKEETNDRYQQLSTTGQPFTQNTGIYNQVFPNGLDLSHIPSRHLTQVPEFYAQDSIHSFVRPPYYIDQNDPGTFSRVLGNWNPHGPQVHEALPWVPSLRLTTSPEDGTPRPEGFSSLIKTRYTGNDNRFPTSFKEVPFHSFDTTTIVNNNGNVNFDESPLKYGQSTPFAKAFDESRSTGANLNIGVTQNSNSGGGYSRDEGFGSSTPPTFETNLDSPLTGNKNGLEFHNLGIIGHQFEHQNYQGNSALKFNNENTAGNSGFYQENSKNQGNSASPFDQQSINTKKFTEGPNKNILPFKNSPKTEINDSQGEPQNFPGNSHQFTQVAQNGNQDGQIVRIPHLFNFNDDINSRSNTSQNSNHDFNSNTNPHDPHHQSQNFNQNPTNLPSNSQTNFDQSQRHFQQSTNNFVSNPNNLNHHVTSNQGHNNYNPSQLENQHRFQNSNPSAINVQTFSLNQFQQAYNQNLNPTSENSFQSPSRPLENGFGNNFQNNPTNLQQGTNFQSGVQSFEHNSDILPEYLGEDKQTFVENTGIDTSQVSLTHEDTGSISLLDQPVIKNPDDPKSVSHSIDVTQISLTDTNNHFNSDIQFPQFDGKGQGNGPVHNFHGPVTNQNSQFPSSTTEGTTRAPVFGSRLNGESNRDPLSNFGDPGQVGQDLQSTRPGFNQNSNDFKFQSWNPKFGPENSNDNSQTFENTERPPTTINSPEFPSQFSTSNPPHRPNNYVTGPSSFPLSNGQQEYTIFSDPDSIDITEPQPSGFSHLRRRADILQQRRRKRRRNHLKVLGGRRDEDDEESDARPLRERHNRGPHSRRRHRINQTPLGQRRSSSLDEGVGAAEDEREEKSREFLRRIDDPVLPEMVSNSTLYFSQPYVEQTGSWALKKLTSSLTQEMVTSVPGIVSEIGHDKPHDQLPPPPNLEGIGLLD